MEKDFRLGRDCIGVGCGAFIFNEKKEVLLMKRGKNVTNQAGWWSKPGGMVEYNEKAITALKREIKEEVGIDIDVWGYLPHTDHIIRNEGQHWLSLNFLANVKKGEVKNMEPDRYDELKWFAIDKLPAKTVSNTKEAAKNYSEKKYIKL